MSQRLLHVKLDRILSNQARMMRHLEIIEAETEWNMATLEEVLADVTDESTKIDSVLTLVDGLKQQVADALAGTTLSPAVQAKVDAVFTQVEANKAKVQAALDANVPTTPTPT